MSTIFIGLYNNFNLAEKEVKMFFLQQLRLSPLGMARFQVIKNMRFPMSIGKRICYL